MSPTPAFELRARRDLLRKVLERLGTAKAWVKWTRSNLFSSPSAQSAKTNWQLQVLQQLVKMGLLVKGGTQRAPNYWSSSVESSRTLREMAKSAKAIDDLLRTSAEAASRSQVEAADSDKNDLEPIMIPPGTLVEAADSEPNSQLDAHILQYVYMIAKAVIDLRDRLPHIERSLDEVLRRLDGVSPPVEQPSDETVAAAEAPVVEETEPEPVPEDDYGLDGDDDDNEDDHSVNGKVGARERAVAFLITLLASAGGPVLVADIEEKAIAAGISARTLRRAAKTASIAVQRNGNQYTWALPLTSEQIAAQKAALEVHVEAGRQAARAMMASVDRSYDRRRKGSSRLLPNALAALAPQVRDAVLFLESTLDENPNGLPAATVVKMAQEETITPHVLQKACMTLGVVTTKQSTGSIWALPRVYDEA